MPERSRKDWEDLCPNLTIDNPTVSPPADFPSEQLATIATDFWKYGYLNLASVFNSDEIYILAQSMENLKKAGIPPVYIYLYDQPWSLFEKLRQLIAYFLGDDYVLLPNLWAWHLWQLGDTGWSPHRDCDSQTVFEIGDDKMLMSLSLWIPLTDVTEDNGCMYVIPRSREGDIPDPDDLAKDKLNSLATPLPAKAGSALGWPQDLIHWGGEYQKTALGPRISLSFEFQNASFDSLTSSVLDTGNPPGYDQKLALIKLQFEKYRHIVPA